MKVKLLFLPVLALALGPLSLPAAGTYDIVPESWITGTGVTWREAAQPHDKALIFPSFPGAAPNGNRFEATKFLKRVNRIPPGVPIRFERTDYRAEAPATNPRLTITIMRRPVEAEHQTSPNREPPSQCLEFQVPPETVAGIRSLSWENFCRLQRDFAQWLVAQNKPQYGVDAFRKPINGFADFEQTLREFWIEVLATATFSGNCANHFADLPVRTVDAKRGGDNAHGLKIGAVSLHAGMRLQIHWIGTVIYTFGAANQSITRPTPTGETTLEVLETDGVAALAISDFQTLSSYPPATGSAAKTVDFYPFGAKSDWGKCLVPVYEDRDLRNAELFRPVERDPKTTKPIRALVLSKPYWYIKADLPRLPRAAASLESSQVTHEILEKDQRMTDDEHFLKTLSGRFVLWPQTSESDPQTWDPVIPRSLADAVRSWDYKPAVFGNASVEVQKSVADNSGRVDWLPLEATLEQFLTTRAVRLLEAGRSATNGSPLLRVVRCRWAPGTGIQTRDYRFWVTTPGEFGKIQLHPRDAVLFAP